ncbi:ArnT family glycosyltransferase [Streptomyces sp. NPDC059373]
MPSRRPTPAFWLRVGPALVVCAAVVHLPSFIRSVWNPDEGFLATQARMLAAGGSLYGTVVDRKPPLLPWLYEGAFAVFGDGSLWPVRVLAVLAHVVTAALLVSLARRRWGDRWGAAAGLGYLLLSIGLAPEDTQAANFEVFTLPWTVAAVWCAERSRWGWAGLACAGALLTKQTGAAVLLPVAWMLWRAARDGKPALVRSRTPLVDGVAVGSALPATAGEAVLPPLRLLRAGIPGIRPASDLLSAAPGDSAGPARTAWAWAWARLAAGVGVPVAVVALAVGARRFVFWTLTGSGTYASASGAWLLALERAVGNAGILVGAGAGLVLPAAYLAVRRRRFADADLWLWLAASVVAVVVGFQFYGHYYLQLMPPLVLLGVAALRELPRWWKAAAIWTALAAGVFLTWGFTVPRTELDHAHTVAAAVQDHTSANATLLVWGMHPEHYWLARRTPATRFLTAGFLTNFSGGRGGARVGEQYAVAGAWRHFRRDLALHPADLIVDDSRGAPYGPSHIPTLAALLADHYEAVATVDGAVLYARVDR